MGLARVSTSDIDIGNTLGYDIIDRNGMLLLKRGAIITSGRQLSMLVERGFYAEEDAANTSPLDTSLSSVDMATPSNKFNPFEIIENCTFKLGRILYNLSQGKNCTDKIALVVQSLMKAYDRDPDAALGAVHMLYGHAYTTIHPIDTATLCYALCKASNIPEQDTKLIMAASLTSNVGMLELQETLHDQTTPLTDEQFKQIKGHPAASVKLLVASGIKDMTWLNIIAQHHERANGQGYPRKMKAEQILTGAKIVALTDCYAAMISPREYKDSTDASKALQTLFLERGKEYDEKLAIKLIKHIGVYPPGSYVKLANGETAVVVKRSDVSTAPMVASVINPKGIPYSRPIMRESAKPEHTIIAIVKNHIRLPFSIASIWGYRD